MYVSRFTGDEDVVLRMPPGRRVSDLKWVSWSCFVLIIYCYPLWRFENSFIQIQKHFDLSSQVALSLVSGICRRLWPHRHRCLTIRPVQSCHQINSVFIQLTLSESYLRDICFYQMLRSSSQQWGVVGETDCTIRIGI